MHRVERLRALACATALVANALTGCTHASVAAQPAAYGLGRPPTAAEIAQIDIDVSPDGAGLPAGGAKADDGAPLFASRCSRCHGAAVALDQKRWPYATTLFDYIRRAMPPQRPRQLSAREIYALTAYLLAANGFIGRTDVVDVHTLPHVAMPGRALFVDSR